MKFVNLILALLMTGNLALAQQAKTKEVMLKLNDGHILFDGSEFLGNKEVVLTLDDGPSPQTTPLILDILKKYNIKAVFFVVGRRLGGNKTGQEILKRMHAEGHAIGNHSYNHPGFRGMLAKNGKQAVVNEIAATHQAIFNATGAVHPFFRFPGGTSNADLDLFIKDSKMTNWKWNIDSLDYEECGAHGPTGNCTRKNTVDEMAQNAIKNIAKGLAKYQKGILLFHDVKVQTAQALPVIIEQMIKDGYTFVLPQVPAEDLSNNPLLREHVTYKTR